MKSSYKVLLSIIVSCGAFAALAKAGGEYQQAYDNEWKAGFVYSVPVSAYVECGAIGGGGGVSTWAQTEAAGCGVGDGGLGVALGVGNGQADYWFGTTTSSGDVYYNLTASGSGGALAYIAVSW